MPLSSKLNGKRALVTAGAQGIGLAISRELLAAGCDVFVHYHKSAEGARTLAGEAKQLGRRCASAAADLTTAEACNQLVADAVKFLGGLDILVNNAGTMIAKLSLADGSDDFWAETMSLNMGSMRRVTRAAAPHLAAAAKAGGGASIVNMSSVAGRKGGAPGTLAYSTAKGATLAFTRALAEELGPQGIRVNAIAPGLILGSQFHVIHTKPEAVAGIVAGIPLGRPGTTEDVARATVFLAAEFDGFITGATLDLNGGAYRA
ncbi:MAG TPA: SDR family oxidoreductase [Opitutaceae bacterium]|nr:SDR family oxidoreductase [Opitutaceae bacterium]